ncbi:MAG: hypothetical protein M3N19_05255 [Candidatus Eremiobacteraeota bacterium]|nr:hypothetical protein [Candidatus Eremiobacteraeota bacterium]
MTNQIRSTASVLLLALLASGCAQKTESSSTTVTQTQSNPEATQAANTAHDPCALLSKSQVSAAIHKPVEAANATDDTHCLYGPKGGGMNSIIVEASWTGADAQFQGGQAANSMMGDTSKAPKVGDASYATAMGNLFYARKGDAYVGIDMRAAAVNVKEVGPALARQALAKM